MTWFSAVCQFIIGGLISLNGKQWRLAQCKLTGLKRLGVPRVRTTKRSIVLTRKFERWFMNLEKADQNHHRNLFLSYLIVGAVCLAGHFAGAAAGQEEPTPRYRTVEDILYRDSESATDYMKERCRLDVYHPVGDDDFATVVWFHGGGLTSGNRIVPEELMNQGIAVVAVNYRLSPQVEAPAYIEDAAAAVAWTFRNIEEYGGSSEKIFVSGHSAGGYLTSMVGIDKRWLAQHNIDANRIAGLIPYSGHTITHFTVRKERGIDGKQPIVDELAPLFHVREDAPPLLLITGDRDLELLGRYEENAYFWRMMLEVGHTESDLMELDGYNHGQMAEPGHPLLIRFVQKHVKRIDELLK